MSDRIVGRRVIRLGVVGSTMDEAARLAAEGAPEGTVVVAEAQTAGRGRGGRPWYDAPGASLLLTVLLRPDVPVPRSGLLSLSTGMAVAEAIEATTGLDPRLKWPNDVWLGDERKVAGVLVTGRIGAGGIEHVLVGIGINVSTPPDELPEGATSLAGEAGRPIDREVLLEALLDRLDARYREFVAGLGRPPLDDWRRRAALVGEAVAIEVAGMAKRGLFLGIDDDGALLLRRPDGTVEAIVAGELVRGPRLAADP